MIHCDGCPGDTKSSQLTPYQQTAIQIVRSRAIDLADTARSEINAILRREALDAGLVDAALAAMRDGHRPTFPSRGLEQGWSERC
jgi:hypothetical protein